MFAFEKNVLGTGASSGITATFAIAGIARSIPAGTLGTRYITGQSIVVDGGQILRESLDTLTG